MTLPPQLAAIAERLERVETDELNSLLTGWLRVVSEPKRKPAQRLLAATCAEAARAQLAGGDPVAILAGAAGALGFPMPKAPTARKPKRHRRRSPGGRWNE